MATTQNKFGLTTTRQMRVAIMADKWLETQAQTIQKMIAMWEYVEGRRTELYGILSEPGLCPEVAAAVNICITQVSVAADQMWMEILGAQRDYAQTVKRIHAAVKAIKD